MLGRFLEFSLPTSDIRASLAFYESIGFAQAAVGDAWKHPYAVVTDGRVCIGLHEIDTAPVCLTFVKPNLLDSVGRLEALGITLEYRHLGDDRFNEIAWFDACGSLIRLIEARTFSPVGYCLDAPSACGYFLQVGIPAANADAAKKSWEQLGFVGMEAADAALPHVACTSDSLDIGLYDPDDLDQPTLLFEAADLRSASARLRAAGIVSSRLPRALLNSGSLMLRGPEGASILVSNASAG